MVKYLELWVKYEDEKGQKYLKPITKEEALEILGELKNPLDK